MQIVQKVALVFTLIGAINWGLIGFFDFNLVTAIFKDDMIPRLIYSIDGICALVNIALLFTDFDHDK